MIEIVSGVYQIRNIVNNKRYVGSTVDIDVRWKTHKKFLNKGVHYNTYLQRAWNKHSEEKFVFEILELVLQGALSKSEFQVPLLAREQHYKDLHKSYDRKHGYDICPIAGNCLGRKLSEAHKQKIGKANAIALKGFKRSEEMCKKLSISHKGLLAGEKNPNYGGISEEHKRNISNSLIGNKYAFGHRWCQSEETRQKISIALRGRKFSEEHKLNISLAAKGNKNAFKGKNING